MILGEWACRQFPGSVGYSRDNHGARPRLGGLFLFDCTNACGELSWLLCFLIHDYMLFGKGSGRTWWRNRRILDSDIDLLLPFLPIEDETELFPIGPELQYLKTMAEEVGLLSARTDGAWMSLHSGLW